MEHTGGVQIYHPSMLTSVMAQSLCVVLMPSSHPFPLTQDDCHTNWVSCVRFSPNAQNPVIVSCGWDKLVKVGRKRFTPGSHPVLFTPQSLHPFTPSPTGVEPHQLQAKNQSFWPQWFSQLCDRLTGWLTLCIRRKGGTASASWLGVLLLEYVFPVH